MIYGYARCSTNESKQDINRQVRELKAAGAEEVYLEYEHGDATVKAEQLKLFSIVKEGDTAHAISQRYAIRLKKLYDLNQMKYSQGVQVGQRLRLR